MPLFDNKSREFYLLTIPLTDSAMEQSEMRLEEALFNMGVIYKEDLLDYEEAIDAFTELLSRYPESDKAPPAHYYLYELYNNIRNPQQSQYHAAQLTNLYPETHYSKLLNNPNYLAELEEEEMKVTRYYESIYQRYQQENYAGVINGADSAIVAFPDDPLVPKFRYIRAMALGSLEGKESMKVALDSLLAWHPSTEEAQQAQEIVDYMYVEFPEIMEADQAAEAEEIYIAEDIVMQHYFMIALHSNENANQVSFDLLNYNLDHYNQYDLAIDKIEMTDSYNVLAVKIFNNREAAERYLGVMEEKRVEILGEIDPSMYRMMIISEQNFGTLTGEKEITPYYLFYRNHYLNQE